MGHSESTKRLSSKIRFKRTILLVLFYAGVLSYLLLVARVNILNFKSSVVGQLQRDLLTQARMQARDIEDRLELLTQKIAAQTCSISNGSSERRPSFPRNLPVQEYYVADRQGRLVRSVSGDRSGNASAVLADIVPVLAGSNGAVIPDREDPSRVWIVARQMASADGSITVISTAWNDLKSYLCENFVSDQQTILANRWGQSGYDVLSNSVDVLEKAVRGLEGTAQVTVASADGRTLSRTVAYCPVRVFNEIWPMAVITANSEIDLAVRTHAEGIGTAMLCLFLVLLIFCGFYYKSEKRRLILEQQTELSKTTSELHLVATEKRQLSDLLKQDLFFYRQLLDALPVGLYWKNEKGELKGSNRMSGKLLMAEKQDACPESANDARLDKEVLTKGMDLLHVPETIDLNGHPCQVLTSRIAMTDKNNHILGMVNCEIPVDIFNHHVHSGTVCQQLENGCLTGQWTLPTMLVDSHRRVRYANPAFANWIHKPTQEITGAVIDDLLHISASQWDKTVGTLDAAGTWAPLQLGEKTMTTFLQEVRGGGRGLVMAIVVETLHPAAGEERTAENLEKPLQAKSGSAGVETAEILIVDDVEENRTLLEMLIAKNICRTAACSSGSEAVELCGRKQFDLILMDIQMPGMDGFEALRQIRSSTLNRRTPLIAMTASEKREDELTALECGFDDYLSKPINRKVMEQKIWRSLQKVRQINDAISGKDIVSFLDGNPDYRKAIEAFVQNLPSRLDEMKQAFEQRDLKSLSFKLHALKGIGGFAGFSVYTEKAKMMEEALEDEQLDTVRLQLDEMVNMCLRTRLKSDCP